MHNAPVCGQHGLLLRAESRPGTAGQGNNRLARRTLQGDEVAAKAGHLPQADTDHLFAIAPQLRLHPLALAHIADGRQADHRKARPDRHHHIAVVNRPPRPIHRVEHLHAVTQPGRQRGQQRRLAAARAAQPGTPCRVVEHDGAGAFQILPLLLVRAQVQQRAHGKLLL